MRLCAEPASGPPAEILDEACFRAARAGVDATLPDVDDRIRPVRELVEETLELVAPAARELHCDACLDGIGELLADGGGAGLQRAAYAGADIDAVLQWLLARTRDAGAPVSAQPR